MLLPLVRCADDRKNENKIRFAVAWFRLGNVNGKQFLSIFRLSIVDAFA